MQLSEDELNRQNAPPQKNLPNNSENDKFNTNRILFQCPSQSENKFILNLPSYLRIKIHSINDVKINDLVAQIKVTIKFDLDITGLP